MALGALVTGQLEDGQSEWEPATGVAATAQAAGTLSMMMQLRSAWHPAALQLMQGAQDDALLLRCVHGAAG